MKLGIFVATLALMMFLVQAQPVSEDSLDSIVELDPAEIDAVGEPEVQDGYAQLLRKETQQEAEGEPGESHSRQKRAICRCYRLSRKRVRCICR